MAEESSEQELLSSREEGILAFFRRPEKAGWTFYGLRSYSLAIILALAFSAACIYGFVWGDTPELKGQCFGGLQTVTVSTIGWFAIAKVKGAA